MDFFRILEIAGVVCGILYLLLIIRENIWCWLFGILSSAITVFIYIEFKLYLEAGLNVFYVLAGIYGWVFWATHRTSDRKTPVTTWLPRSHVIAISASLLLTLGIGQLMETHTDSPRPFVDAGLTVFAFVATYMEARKVLSAWHYWFVINGISIWLHADRELYFYAGLSVFYTLLCIKGYREWKKSYVAQTA
ncbi:MAG: nicotinamide riboside transporter PnuC [Solitalea sp.]